MLYSMKKSIDQSAGHFQHNFHKKNHQNLDTINTGDAPSDFSQIRKRPP